MSDHHHIKTSVLKNSAFKSLKHFGVDYYFRLIKCNWHRIKIGSLLSSVLYHRAKKQKNTGKFLGGFAVDKSFSTPIF